MKNKRQCDKHITSYIFVVNVLHLLGSLKPVAPRKNSKGQTAKGTSIISLKDWRYAFRGPTGCRAPLRIPDKGKKYTMCPK